MANINLLQKLVQQFVGPGVLDGNEVFRNVTTADWDASARNLTINYKNVEGRPGDFTINIPLGTQLTPEQKEALNQLISEEQSVEEFELRVGTSDLSAISTVNSLRTGYFASALFNQNTQDRVAGSVLPVIDNLIEIEFVKPNPTTTYIQLLYLRTEEMITPDFTSIVFSSPGGMGEIVFSTSLTLSHSIVSGLPLNPVFLYQTPRLENSVFLKTGLTLGAVADGDIFNFKIKRINGDFVNVVVKGNPSLALTNEQVTDPTSRKTGTVSGYLLDKLPDHFVPPNQDGSLPEPTEDSVGKFTRFGSDFRVSSKNPVANHGITYENNFNPYAGVAGKIWKGVVANFVSVHSPQQGWAVYDKTQGFFYEYDDTDGWRFPRPQPVNVIGNFSGETAANKHITAIDQIVQWNNALHRVLTYIPGAYSYEWRKLHEIEILEDTVANLGAEPLTPEQASDKTDATQGTLSGLVLSGAVKNLVVTPQRLARLPAAIEGRKVWIAEPYDSGYTPGNSQDGSRGAAEVALDFNIGGPNFGSAIPQNNNNFTSRYDRARYNPEDGYIYLVTSDREVNWAKFTVTRMNFITKAIDPDWSFSFEDRQLRFFSLAIDSIRGNLYFLTPYYRGGGISIMVVNIQSMTQDPNLALTIPGLYAGGIDISGNVLHAIYNHNYWAINIISKVLIEGPTRYNFSSPFNSGRYIGAGGSPVVVPGNGIWNEPESNNPREIGLFSLASRTLTHIIGPDVRAALNINANYFRIETMFYAEGHIYIIRSGKAYAVRVESGSAVAKGLHRTNNQNVWEKTTDYIPFPEESDEDKVLGVNSEGKYELVEQTGGDSQVLPPAVASRSVLTLENNTTVISAEQREQYDWVSIKGHINGFIGPSRDFSKTILINKESLITRNYSIYSFYDDSLSEDISFNVVLSPNGLTKVITVSVTKTGDGPTAPVLDSVVLVAGGGGATGGTSFSNARAQVIDSQIGNENRIEGSKFFFITTPNYNRAGEFPGIEIEDYAKSLRLSFGSEKLEGYVSILRFNLSSQLPDFYELFIKIENKDNLITGWPNPGRTNPASSMSMDINGQRFTASYAVQDTVNELLFASFGHGQQKGMKNLYESLLGSIDDPVFNITGYQNFIDLSKSGNTGELILAQADLAGGGKINGGGSSSNKTLNAVLNDFTVIAEKTVYVDSSVKYALFANVPSETDVLGASLKTGEFSYSNINLGSDNLTLQIPNGKDIRDFRAEITDADSNIITSSTEGYQFRKVASDDLNVYWNAEIVPRSFSTLKIKENVVTDEVTTHYRGSTNTPEPVKTLPTDNLYEHRRVVLRETVGDNSGGLYRVKDGAFKKIEDFNIRNVHGDTPLEPSPIGTVQVFYEDHHNEDLRSDLTILTKDKGSGRFGWDLTDFPDDPGAVDSSVKRFYFKIIDPGQVAIWFTTTKKVGKIYLGAAEIDLQHPNFYNLSQTGQSYNSSTGEWIFADIRLGIVVPDIYAAVGVALPIQFRFNHIGDGQYLFDGWWSKGVDVKKGIYQVLEPYHLERLNVKDLTRLDELEFLCLTASIGSSHNGSLRQKGIFTGGGVVYPIVSGFDGFYFFNNGTACIVGETTFLNTFSRAEISSSIVNSLGVKNLGSNENDHDLLRRQLLNADFSSLNRPGLWLSVKLIR